MQGPVNSDGGGAGRGSTIASGVGRGVATTRASTAHGGMGLLQWFVADDSGADMVEYVLVLVIVVVVAIAVESIAGPQINAALCRFVVSNGGTC